MNGVHDMGGMQCYGPVDLSGTNTLFYEDWERRVLALTVAMGATGTWNLDKSRSVRESLPPAYYLSAGYYRIWLAGLEQLLLEYELVTQAELGSGRMLDDATPVTRVLHAGDVQAAMRKGSPVNRPAVTTARFAVGDSVTLNSVGNARHTRLPAYIRGCTGTVYRVHGCHVFPDAHAQGLGEDPKWLYNVRFEGQDLWGEAPGKPAAVHVDCWEPYLE